MMGPDTVAESGREGERARLAAGWKASVATTHESVDFDE